MSEAHPIDPITAEILRHTLLSIPKQVDTNITKTAYSPLVYEYKDYAVGMVDHAGRLISQGGGGAPIFIANALGVAVGDGLAIHGADGMRRGDVLITNHSGTLGQHLNNVVGYTPIYAGGALFAFMAVVVHWIDVGGLMIGSTPPTAREIFHEGVQIRQLKLLSQGRPNPEVFKTIEANTRLPRELMGDIDAQVAGCLRGRDLFEEVLRKYGASTVRQAIDLMWSRSEAAARAVVRGMPDGDYHAASWLDYDPGDPGEPLPVRVRVNVAGEDLTVDFTGTAPQAKGPINSGLEGGAVACARIAFKFLASPNETANEGSFRPLKVLAPDGSLISADANAPMGQYSTILPTIIDTILKAVGPAVPELTAGGHHGAMSGIFFAGTDPATGKPFMFTDTYLGGWGASQGSDGPGPYKTMVHGDTLETPVEAMEARHPLRVETYSIRADSGGAGEFRGGAGIEKVVLALAPCTAMVVTDRTVTPAWGVLGGLDGLPARGILERPGQPPQFLRRDMVELAAGDRIRVLTGGGGGYGDPRRRDPARVSQDVRRGYVSREAAAEVYGVALDDELEVLAEATARLRAVRPFPVRMESSEPDKKGLSSKV